MPKNLCEATKLSNFVPCKRLESAKKKQSLFRRIFGVKEAVSGRE